MRRTALIATMAALTVVPAMANVNIGDPAPSISAGSWFNLPEGLSSLTSKHLKGRIVMVEFWATWCKPCRAGIPHLVDMQRKYKNKGLVLVALSYEPGSKVGPFVGQNDMSYIVGAEADSMQDAFGIRGYPTAILIDPDGKVAWKGHPLDAEEVIERLLRTKPPRAVGALGVDAAKRDLQNADQLLKNGQYARAMSAYEEITRDFAGTHVAVQAHAQIRKMNSDPRIMEAIRKDEAQIVAGHRLSIARKLAGNGAETDAARQYKQIIEEFPDSTHAEVARIELARLNVGAPDS